MTLSAASQGTALRVAYLVNQYPKPSHSFIRREIHALERQGVEVLRYAVRRCGDPLVDADDRAELGRTQIVLAQGVFALLAAVFLTLLTSPTRWAKVLLLAGQLGWRAERPLWVHAAYFVEACWLHRAWAKRGVDHVHAHFGSNPATLALLVRVLGGPPYSFTVHGPQEFDMPDFIGLTRKIHHADFVVAVSDFGRSQLMRWSAAADWEKLLVVHCGLEPGYAGAASAAASSAQRVVCVGRLCEQKGQLLLLQAVHALRNDGCAIELVLAGDGEMRATLETEIERLALTDCVSITGWIDAARVREELLASRALVLPSFAEGLPVVLMEAMALSRPVIATWVAGIPELVDASCGWLIAPARVDALAVALRECMSADAATLERMGDVGRQRVLARHNVDRETARLAAAMAASAGHSVDARSEVRP